MSDTQKLPFHSLSFSLIEGRRPREFFRMSACENGEFEIQVQKGSATRPIQQFTRRAPLQRAAQLRDALQALGVFSWEGDYGDTSRPGSMRWSLIIVFEKDVFSMEAKGGSDTPPAFEDMLEELYRLDFPRPQSGAREQYGQGEPQAASGMQGMQGVQGIGSALNMLGGGSFGRFSAGDLGAYAATGQIPPGFDDAALSGLSGLMSNISNMNPADLQDMMAHMQANPQLMQQRMKEEFQHMSPAEQNEMLDALAATGMATREWWERFLRG